MATLAELVSYFAEMTGTRREEGVVRARHLREAGLLSSTGRGKGAANVTSLDCAVYLIAWLATERAINGPEAIRLFDNLLPNSLIGDPKKLRSAARNLVLLHDAQFLLPGVGFIEAVAQLIEWARSKSGYEILEKDFEALGCCRDWPSAFLRLRDGEGGQIVQIYSPPPLPMQPHKIRLGLWQTHRLSAPASITVDAIIPTAIISLLADFLEDFDREPPHLSDVQLPEKPSSQ